MLLDENLVEGSKDVTTCVNIDTLQLENINIEEINQGNLKAIFVKLSLRQDHLVIDNYPLN